MKNIAVIVTQLNNGGAERIAGLLSKELAKYYNVYLFLLNTENIVYEYGGTIVDIGKSGAFYEYEIRSCKKKYHIDCAISFLEPLNFANIRTRETERILISERSVQSCTIPPEAAERLQIQRYYNYADEIITCSEGVKFDLIHNYGVKGNLSTIYNFINQEEISLRSQGDLPEEVRDFLRGSDFFLNVGRLHPQKNQKRLLRQFSYFCAKNSGVKLLILGSGGLRTELDSWIAELGLEDCVKIIPYTSNPFVYIGKAKALILSSRYEGLPNAVLEAMTLGCPVIATDCLSGPRELLQDEMDYEKKLDPLLICKRGILVCDEPAEDHGTTRYMAQAMERLHRDPQLAEDFRRSGLVYMKNYTNQQIVQKWIEAIESGRRVEPADLLGEEEDRLYRAKHIVLYGAGNVGRAMYCRLSKRFSIDCFAVSRRKAGETKCLGVPVREVEELEYAPDETAVIAGVSGQYQNEVVTTLLARGYENVVFPYIEPLSCTYYANCKDLDLKAELIEWYQAQTGMDIDLDHPRTFNEKLQWLKLYDNLPIKAKLADKYEARKYVKEKIGEKYLVPLLGAWDSFDKIDFPTLPSCFVLKCNHGSGMNLIVQDKACLDYHTAKSKFDSWMATDYAYMSGFEMQYAKIPRRILAEKLLEMPAGEDLRDYKVFVFNGKAKLIQVDIDRDHAHRRNLYTPEWEYVPCSIKYPTAPDIVVERPACLGELIYLAEVLAAEFIHARVDFYIWSGQIFFGEMTFTHGSGIELFEPEEYGLEMGSWMELPKGE